MGFSRQEHWSGSPFLLQCMKVKSESEVTQSCLTPSDPMDCSPPGPSVHGIFQARVLEWGAIAFSALSDLHICNTVLLTGVVMRYITFLWFSFLKITIYFWLYSVFIAGWGLLSGCGVCLGGLSNQIFASKYTLCLPDKEQLIAEVKRMLEIENWKSLGCYETRMADKETW